MKATLKGNKLTLELDYDESGNVSTTGKSLIHATTSGNLRTSLPNGQTVSIGVNVFSPNPSFKKS